jgi:hypothetical protein
MRTLFQRGLLLACLIVPVAARSDNAAQLKIDNFKFGPEKLTVAKGTEVTWTNQDDIPHSIVLTALGVRSNTLVPRARNFVPICRHAAKGLPVLVHLNGFAMVRLK